ncbi:MAG: iron-containing alcohol dehydrogenase [Candidatus Marinimicrobia bacterium]|nr:iron-containing alcohol dehydrogenase [Candidatus Neomarinimicrobiota bacterium]
MYDFKVRSNIHDYTVSFITDTLETLDRELGEGDYILVDRNILELYSPGLETTLSKQKFIIIDANETQKSYAGIIPIIENLILNGFRKNHRLIAIGGGITQDITSFISSVLYRGVDWIFFPTTLLAQCDSCIGSKTSINFGAFKNQIGGFYPPLKIFINTAFLTTLPPEQIMSGLGEMCHYFPIAGEADFIRYAREYQLAIQDPTVMEGLICRSLEIKKGYIEIDEYDRKERQIFNYGHSFGHALESLTDYRIPHGIAVSYGLDMANYVSVKMGLLEESIRIDMRAVLKNIWKGTSISDVSIDRFLTALTKDKKNVGTELRLILSEGYGKIVKKSVKLDQKFSDIIQQYFREELSK